MSHEEFKPHLSRYQRKAAKRTQKREEESLSDSPSHVDSTPEEQKELSRTSPVLSSEFRVSLSEQIQPVQFSARVKLLLDSFDHHASRVPGLSRGFRLELSRESWESEQLVLRIRYSPITWFQRVLRSEHKEEKDAVRVARAWIATVRTRAATKPHWMHQLDDPAGPFLFAEKCEYGPACWEKEKGCSGNHRIDAMVRCQDLVWRRDGSKRECGDIGHTALLLDELSTTEYAVFARREATRDILIQPRRHHSINRKMAVDSRFWQFLFDTCRKVHQILGTERFPVIGVALNFGDWETRTSVDKFAKDCHAHAHLLLTPEAVFKCTERLLSPLKGRVYDPQDHELEDCLKLENEELSHLERKTSEEYAQSMERRFTSLENGQAQLEKRLVSLENGQNLIMDMLRSLLDRA